MKYVQTFDNYVNEGASRINPGTKMIKAGLAGAPSAAQYVAAAKQALENWGKVQDEIAKARKEKKKDVVNDLKQKKKEMLSKLMDIKTSAAKKYPEEMKKVPSEKKQAAAEKAPEVSKMFTDAIKKREKKDQQMDPGVEKKEEPKEEPEVDTEKLKDEMKEAIIKMKEIQQDLQTEEGLKKLLPDIYKRAQEGEDISDEEAEAAAEKLFGPLAKRVEEIDKILKDQKGKNESTVWEEIDRVLEFDADAKIDSLASTIKSAASKAAGNEGDTKDEDEDDDEVGKKMEEIDKKIEEYKENLKDAVGQEKQHWREKISELEDEYDKLADERGGPGGPDESASDTTSFKLKTFESFKNSEKI